MAEEVLERRLYHAGTIIISSLQKDNHNAYWVKEGEVLAFMQKDDGKIVEIARYGPGAIVGEGNLINNGTQEISFRTVVDSTLITLTRHDFERNIKKLDKTTQSLFYTMVDKISKLEKEKQDHLIKSSDIEDEAYSIVNHLLRNMPHDRQKRYESVLLPPFNLMIKDLEEIKTQERHERQKNALEKRVNELKTDAPPDEVILDKETERA